ncbi:zf-H2C2-domain-containing protein, partial [Tuber magnatum]
NAPVLPPPNPNPVLHPRSVYLRDHVSIATVHPVMHASRIPASLIDFLCTEFNNEIERGNTYPLEEPMSLENFTSYWFGTFGAVMLLGGKEEQTDLSAERDWSTQCLGTFYVKPNYPGRSSHICNAGFLTTFTARGKGCGKHLGEAFLDYAPKLGYTYSMFNLIYETNIASCKIWDSLGFKRIGKVKGAGRLSSSNYLVDAIIFGRDLNDDEDYVSDERFDKIRFYLEKGKYPPTADRSEKSRLRSAATHYKLENGKLMLKDKEVVSDGQMQYEIARSIHCQSHGGINKTTASIAEKFHWVRIKETVSQVIRNCAECKEHAKAPVVKGDRFNGSPVNPTPPQPQ